MIRLDLGTQGSANKLTLVQETHGQGLTLEQFEYWQGVRELERLSRQHFTVETANEIVGRLRIVATEAFSRDTLTNVDEDALDEMRYEIAKKGIEIRNTKLWRKVKALAWLFGGAVPLIAIWKFVMPVRNAIGERLGLGHLDLVLELNILGALGFGILGLTIGAISKSLFSNRVVSAQGLANLDNYEFSHALYLLYLIIVLVLALICASFGLFTVGIAGIDLGAAINVPPNAFVLGFICGFSETAIATKISSSIDANVRS